MKKIIIIIAFIILLTGCSNVKNLSYDELLQTIADSSGKCNTYRTGYKYYLPQGMQVADSTLYNEVIEDGFYKYYLYVDVVSYFKEVGNSYSINNDAIYSKIFEFDDKFGYLEINKLENNEYLLEIMYNYAKIEVMVDESDINVSLLSAINIIKSIEYNDSIISNLLGDDILNFYEEEFDIFDTITSEDDYITVDSDYQESEESSEIPDTDLIN